MKEKNTEKSCFLSDKDFNIEKMRQLSYSDQEMLCGELREKITETVTKNGGHLASNLGVCELTVGMYNVFDPFKDKIVWDVGHQTYAHKILTGRGDRFDTLRQKDGLSGFPKRNESSADAFNTGHSSTSVSAALGMARAAKITGENYYSVAVIGDGALTGGQAFEALNDAAGHEDKLIVVLNDNGMSISKNVGGLSRYLGKIRTTDSYINLKKGVKGFLSAIPKIGPALVKKISKFKLSFKMLFIPGEFFEYLGFVYIGPVDGHNIKAVTEAMKKATVPNKPCVVHVITKKGKGYIPAEENPEKYHGVPEKVSENNSNSTAPPQESFSRAFAEGIIKIAEQDEKAVAITAAMPSGTKLELFRDKFPGRFFDVGIAEQHAVTLAAGMSSCGLKPFLAVYSTFSQRAVDQILHDAALQNLPVVIGLDRSGAVGRDGETHQGIYDIPLIKAIPGATICAPATCGETESCLLCACEMFAENSSIPKGPFIIRYPAKAPAVDWNENIPYEYGKAVTVYTGCGSGEQNSVVIVGLGPVLGACISACKMLCEEGISATCINARFAKPIDAEFLVSVTKDAKLVVTVEDGSLTGGFGESVRSILPGKKTVCMGYPEEQILQGSIEEIHEKYGLTAAGILETVRNNYEN